MAKRFVITLIALVALLAFSTASRAQTAKPVPPASDSAARLREIRGVYDFDRPGEKPAPAPRHDISGIWQPAEGPGEGIQADGAQLMPSDGKPEHEPPYTALGRAAFEANKPS